MTATFFSQAPFYRFPAIDRIWHAYPAFVINNLKKVFAKKGNKVTTVEAEVVFDKPLSLPSTEPEPMADPITPDTSVSDYTYRLLFDYDYYNYDRDFILHQFTESDTQKKLKELWLEMACIFEDLITETGIELTKSQGYRRKGKLYFRVAKGDYIIALLKLNTALNNKLGKGR